MKTRVAVIFGGRSVEHEVSVISGIQALQSIDAEKYDAFPVYLTKENEFYVGDEVGNIESYKNIKNLLEKSQRVVWVKEAGEVHLVPYPKKLFGGMKDQIVDVALPVVHGTNVEDGSLQGYLKTVGVPFAGCDVCASAIGMDKYLSKAVLKDNDIPVLPGYAYTVQDYENLDNLISQIENKLGYPVIIKPVNSGSSVGISVAKNRDELIDSVDDAFKYSCTILAEKAITALKEINCSVLGDENGAKASILEEPFHSKDILSYEDKYMSGGGSKGGSKSGGGTKSAGMASVQRKIPADLSPERTKEIQEYALRAFKAFGCSGVARIDFMIDEETDALYFNEINTIPGSLSFYLWEPTGVPYGELLDQLIQMAVRRARREENTTYTFDTNILNENAFSGTKGVK